MNVFMEYLTIIFTSAFISNVVLSRFLGICPFLGVSKKRSSAIGMGAAIVFVVFTAAVISYGIQYLILEPLKIEYLQTMVFILIIASLVQFLEFFMKKRMIGLYKTLGIYLPLITTNCVVLGVAKTVADTSSSDVKYNFGEACIYALGTAVGYAIVIFLFSAIREKLEIKRIPKPFRGVPIALVVVAIMALAFRGFSGLF